METLPPGVSSFPDSILPFCDLPLSAPGSEQANPDPQSLRGGAAESSGGLGRHLQVRMSRICRFTLYDPDGLYDLDGLCSSSCYMLGSTCSGENEGL